MNKEIYQFSNKTQTKALKKNPYILITGKPGEGRSFIFPSPNQSMIAIPKAIFELPLEEKAKAFKELEENLSQYKRKEN
ncbi:hypothetical protein ACVRWL_09960 [Streptococcus ratti]|uniref:Uncharacterized protein n=1 Tax=Streptococcus ratti TaxID=1341 RepID=A0A7X9LEV1_STRRT|nr:hypothetical protein [Streptococcus ratti]NMD49978.1 hypothetical protein [Streptococcus ratti]